MKRPHKNFVVEYKGGTRRQPDKPTSIWGNLDLKSISRDVEKENRSHAEQTPGKLTETIGSADLQLTPSDEQSNNILPAEEDKVMAEDERVARPKGNEASISPPVAEIKKRRGRPAKDTGAAQRF